MTVSHTKPKLSEKEIKVKLSDKIESFDIKTQDIFQAIYDTKDDSLTVVTSIQELPDLIEFLLTIAADLEQAMPGYGQQPPTKSIH